MKILSIPAFSGRHIARARAEVWRRIPTVHRDDIFDSVTLGDRLDVRIFGTSAASLFGGGNMMDDITVSRKQATEIFKALDGISELLKTMAPQAENSAVMYGIMSNIAVVRMNLIGTSRVNSN